jgi:prepilin-type N-terminal cleavage/methylation domain-containing protein
MAKCPHEQSGFTLTEMLVALSILIFGLTALAGSMTVGVSQRRGTDMQFRSVNMVDFIVRDLRESYLLAHAPDGGPLPNIDRAALPGFPGMKYQVKFVVDPEHSLVVLARIFISWEEQGERVAEEFQRILIREKPFSHRISLLKNPK